MGKTETDKLGQILRVLSRRGDPASKLEAIRGILDAKAPKAKKPKPAPEPEPDAEQPELPEAEAE